MQIVAEVDQSSMQINIVVALSGDMPHPGVIKYTLVYEADIGLDGEIAENLSQTRSAAREFMKKLA
jgi:hypothetical protein